MSNLYDQIVRERGTVRNWMDRIPGLGGYLDKGDRRTADRMIREHLAKELQQRLSRFINMEKQILKTAGMSAMTDTREAKTKFQTYIDKVKAAPPGYSGFFAAIDVDDMAMERLYAFDEAQIRYVDRMDAALNDLETAIEKDEAIQPAVQAIYNLAQEAMEAFSLREDVLTDLNTKYS
jgi:hypothetical protein